MGLREFWGSLKKFKVLPGEVYWVLERVQVQVPRILQGVL